MHISSRQLSSLVGRIRLNDSVSPTVVSAFSDLPSTMDRIEIFDSSIANDPSPPCKAAAVLLRSTLRLPSGIVPCTTVMRQKVFDYNNRDFQKYQLQNLVDQIAENWLLDNGGGVQLTLHRRSLEPAHRNTNNLTDESIFAKSVEFGPHRNLFIYPATYFRFSPWGPISKTITPMERACESKIDGLESCATSFTDGERIVTIASVDVLKRRLIAYTTDVVKYSEFQPFAQFLLRRHLCVELELFCASFDKSLATCNSLVVNYKQVNVDVVEELREVDLLSSKFIA